VTTSDILDRALEDGGSRKRVPASLRALLDVAAEVAEALAATRLTRAEQERIYARSLAMLEEAVHEQRRGWQRVLHLDRPAPVLVGGAAALTLGAAAIGWAVLHGRRAHPPLAA
jgi:hypothetical protein